MKLAKIGPALAVALVLSATAHAADETQLTEITVTASQLKAPIRSRPAAWPAAIPQRCWRTSRA